MDLSKSRDYKGDIEIFKNNKEEGSKSLDISELLQELISINPATTNTVFRQLVLLAVHGTTEMDESKFYITPKSTDAYFKKGIFIHSKKSSDKSRNTDEFLACDIDDEFFMVDVYANSPTL